MMVGLGWGKGITCICITWGAIPSCNNLEHAMQKNREIILKQVSTVQEQEGIYLKCIPLLMVLLPSVF